MAAKPAKPAASPKTESERIKFLMEISNGKTVTKAAEAAGIPRRRVYDWRDQSPSFAQAWDDAVAGANEVLLDEVRERALDRNDARSYLLLMFLVKAKYPEFKENYKQELTVKHEEMKEFAFSQSEVDEALAILNRAKETKEDIGS